MAPLLFLYMRTGIKTEEKMAMGEKEITNMATIVENGEDRFFSVLEHVDCLSSSVWVQFARVDLLLMCANYSKNFEVSH